MIPLDDDAVEIDFDNGRARLHAKRVPVHDDHDLANSLTQGLGLPGGLGFTYPAIPPVASKPAKVSFDVQWNGVLAAAQIQNTAQQFKGLFLSTGATIYWTAEAEGFRFESEAPNPSANLISVLGSEKNGVFFS